MTKQKEFYQEWTEQEIEEYIDQFSVLVLFEIHAASKEAEIVVHGKLTEDQKHQLLIVIVALFGGTNMSVELCSRINEFAEKWYTKIVLKKKARVINFSKKEKK